MRRTTTTRGGCVAGCDWTGGTAVGARALPQNSQLQVRNGVSALPATRHRLAAERISARAPCALCAPIAASRTFGAVLSRRWWRWNGFDHEASWPVLGCLRNATKGPSERARRRPRSGQCRCSSVRSVRLVVGSAIQASVREAACSVGGVVARRSAAARALSAAMTASRAWSRLGQARPKTPSRGHGARVVMSSTSRCRTAAFGGALVAAVGQIPVLERGGRVNLDHHAGAGAVDRPAGGGEVGQ